RESRNIQKELRIPQHGVSLKFINSSPVDPSDLFELLNKHTPQVVHFVGHGAPKEEIVFLDKGEARPVSEKLLAGLFHGVEEKPVLVILDACFSQVQTEGITKEIDCVIGVKSEIGVDVATAWATDFYRALASGMSVGKAYGLSFAVLWQSPDK